MSSLTGATPPRRAGWDLSLVCKLNWTASLAGVRVSNLSLTFKVPPAAYARSAAPIIQQQLAAVGINVSVVPVEWADWIANVFQGAYDYDLTMVSHVEAICNRSGHGLSHSCYRKK